MQNRFWLMSDAQQRGLFAPKKPLSQRKMQRQIALLCFGVMLMAVALLLSGCQTLPQQPCEMQPPPKMPALSEPVPSESYSLQWQKLAEEWRKKLTFTQTTPER